MKVKSPLTGLPRTRLDKTLDAEFIIQSYKKQLHIDVSRFFQGIKKIQIYKCLDTGYRFYYPFNTSGDSKFYEYLEKFPWYYMDWKWEHKIASNLIKPKNRVLEIGCGRGSFIKKIQQKGADCIGLELNENAVSYGQDKKVNILKESIQNHAKNNNERYDVVCSFQVVEHIAKIKEFLQSSINVLKPGGRLVISVPNNDSLILKYYDNIVLNMPPHHMGMWDINSLISIQKKFNLQLDNVFFEPLQNYHLEYASLYLEEKLSSRLLRKYHFIPPLIRKIARPFWKFCAKEMSEYIFGQTIVATYIKI